MAHLRVDQVGAEVVGMYAGTAHARVNQVGAEAVGSFNASKLRVDQVGAEVVATWMGGGLLRANQFGVEVVGQLSPPTVGLLRVNQVGIETVGSLRLGIPAGDTTGYEYYIGPGFVAGTVPKRQPSSYEPQWGPVQDLIALGNLIGIAVTAVGGTISGVPLTGTTPLDVVFTTPFAQACYCVIAVYVPTSLDSVPIYVYGNTCPSGTTPTAQGFQILGQLVNGTEGQATGTFQYIAIGE